VKIERSGAHFTLECSRHELEIISNSLNNIPQAVSIQDYSSLIGANKADVEKMLDQVVDALRAD
jgi:hypothetical protein